MKRRELLKGLAVASIAAVATQRSWADGTNDDEKMVEFLFVQNASSITLKDGRLKLEGVAPDTLYFSDRPDRIVGRVTTKQYVDHWSVGGNSFADDPPNAVLSIQQEPESKDIVVVLRNPKLEGAELVYDVDVLDGDKVASGEASALFIDVIGRPLTPLSIAGVARRTARRTTRRVERRR